MILVTYNVANRRLTCIAVGAYIHVKAPWCLYLFFKFEFVGISRG